MHKLPIDKSWTLFLDRDGVINQERKNQYVNHWNEFVFMDGVLEALKMASSQFGQIVVITNQRGVGRGITPLTALHDIHQKMIGEIETAGGRIDKVFYCTDVEDDSPNRKPQPGMALQAKSAFPAIDFSKTIMVGNTVGDMGFAINIGAVPVFITSTQTFPTVLEDKVEWVFPSLFDFMQVQFGSKNFLSSTFS